jgi:endoglucanase
VRGSGRRVVAMLATGAVALAASPSAAHAGIANRGLPGAGSNPIAHMTWAAPRNDGPWSAYESARGANRTLLGRLAAQPRALWLGWWCPVGSVRAQAAQTVALAQNGNPNVLTEFATYELYPWAVMQPDGFDQPDLKGSWNVRSDETWYRNMAAGIGSARALVVEQIDLPFARRIPSTAPEQIDTYAARVLSANAHTTVYIDIGTYTWLSPTQAATLLIRNGVAYARGFSLNDTGYESTSDEDVYGASIVAALSKQGVHGKRFIVDTVENGQPYLPRNVGHGKGLNDTTRCHAGANETPCQRLGIQPTTNVASPQWKLTAAASKDARLYCDGYVWSGQPWDIDGGPFLKKYALWLAANSKYRLTTQPTPTQPTPTQPTTTTQITTTQTTTTQTTTTQTTTTQTTTTQTTTTQTTNALARRRGTAYVLRARTGSHN